MYLGGTNWRACGMSKVDMPCSSHIATRFCSLGGVYCSLLFYNIAGGPFLPYEAHMTIVHHILAYTKFAFDMVRGVGMSTRVRNGWMHFPTKKTSSVMLDT